jgi:hypothetical protein
MINYRCALRDFMDPLIDEEIYADGCLFISCDGVISIIRVHRFVGYYCTKTPLTSFIICFEYLLRTLLRDNESLNFVQVLCVCDNLITPFPIIFRTFTHLYVYFRIKAEWQFNMKICIFCVENLNDSRPVQAETKDLLISQSFVRVKTHRRLALFVIWSFHHLIILKFSTLVMLKLYKSYYRIIYLCK